jgi:hypothetical protein
MADFWDKVNQKNTSGNYSDDYWNKVAGSGYGLEPPEEPSSNPVRRLVADPLVGLAKGAAVGIPETIVGLLDIPTMGHAGKVAETVSRGLGLGDFKSANEMFDNLLTPETREAQLKVSEAKGFLPTIATAIQNPSSIVQTVAESIPSMVAGMRAAGAVSKLIGKPLVEAGVANLPRIAKVGGIAEGAITAGQNIEQVRQQTEEGTLTPSQVAINTLSGVLTGMIGVAGGRLAQRFGLEDVDTLFTGGRSGIVGDKEKGIFKKVLMGAFQEGVLEELPQSMQEQIAQNLALNKPIDDGVFEAGAMGMLAGFAQSTGANIAGSTMRKMKNELDPINQTIKKTVEETLAGELSAIGGWDNGKIDETIKQIPWQDFTLKGEPYQEGVTVGKPYGGEILRPVRPEKPESALDAEFQTIRRIEAPRKEERKILPPGQGFELVGEREKVNTGREIKEIKELQNNIAEREQYISRSEAFKGTEMYNKNVARLEEDKVKLQELTGTIPKTAEVETTSQDKQPWEMTASEFDETFGGTGRIGYGWIEKLGDGKITEKQYDEAVRLAKKNAAQVLPDIESTIHINKTSADTHKGIIRNALSEGKPVPPEVLKDYPDLARRSGIALETAPLPPVKPSVPSQENAAAGQNIAANELLKQKEVNRKTIQEMIKNGIITEDSIIRGTDIKYIKAIIKNNDTLPTGKDFEGNDVISASKYIPGNELPMYGGAGGNHVVMIGKSNLLEGKGEGINDWNIKPESPASDFNYIYKGKKYNYDDIKKILQKKTTDEEMMADKTARKVVRGIKNPKNLSELKQKQDQILLMREGKKKKTGEVKTVKTQPDKVSIPEIPETLNLVLHQMKNDVESGTAGGKQGVDEAGNTIYAKSGYMPWFSDLVKRYANKKTSPSGEKESISAKYLVNIINKGLKGDKLTPGQQGVWEEVNKIADHESGKTYAGLVNQFEKAREAINEARQQLQDEQITAGEIEANSEDIETGLLSSLEDEGNLTGEQANAAREEVNNFLNEMSKAEEPRTETTKAGKQVTIPGASAAETFNLANPETEISKKLPEQATPKNADMFGKNEEKPKSQEEELYNNLKTDLLANIDYLKTNKLTARINIDYLTGRTDDDLLKAGLLTREAKNKIKDIVDIVEVEPELGKLIDKETAELMKFRGYSKKQYSIKKQPVFFSQLLKVAESKLPNAGTSEQFRTMINTWANKGEFKADELKWSGLNEWLAGQTGKISKQNVVDYLKQNQVEIKEITKGNNNETKFAQWQLPGGENYKELLLTLPEKSTPEDNLEWKQNKKGLWAWFSGGKQVSGAFITDEKETPYSIDQIKEQAKSTINKKTVEKIKGNYASPHWDEPNVLAHVRMNDRTDVEGNKVLFLEEVQSDWHQEGRKKGYAGNFEEAAKTTQDYLDTLYKKYKTTDMAKVLDKLSTPEEKAEYYRLNDLANKTGAMVPPAPFSKTWPELVMKRMLRYASENGYEKLAWTPGSVQAERYDLSKQIEKIDWGKNWDNTYDVSAITKTGQNVTKRKLSASGIEDFIGKDLTKKITESVEEEGILEGLDLKVGGEGMKGFYDLIIPSYLSKYAKKWGAKVGETQIDAGNISATTTVHSIGITDSMRESVMSGQPMFSKGTKETYAIPTLADVQNVFKQHEVSQIGDNFLLHKEGLPDLVVKSVDQITPDKFALNIGYSKAGLSENEVIAGKYTSGKIELAKTAADKWTLSHESVHFMEDLGVINNNEVHLLKWYIQSLVKEGKFKTQNKNDIGGTEDRAEFLAQSLQKEPKGLSRIINKIQDFIDKLVNAFGIRTVRGIQRDVISGEIYNKETNAQKETRLDIEGGIEKGLNDLYEQEKKNKFSIKEGQPEKAKDDSGNRWWEDRDINAELKALPKEYWEGDVRDFIKEGYVPITRSEADELYKNKLDPFVSWVMLKGQETTGTEGLFMKPLTYKGYNPYYYETNTIRTDQEATELYQKYLHRYLGQTLSPAGRKDFIEKRMRDAADVWREEAELQKIAETGAGSQEERQAEQYFIRPLDYISSYIPDSLSSWFKQTSTNSIPPAGISQSNSTWEAPQKTLWDSFMYSIADRQIDLRDTQKSIDTFAKSIGKLVSDTLNPSQKEQLFSSRLSKRVSDYATKEFRPVIEAMDNTGITTGQIEDYLHARHAEEANNYIRSLTDIKGFTEITNGKDKGKYTNENGHILSKSEYKELSEATIDESGRIINDADEVIGYQDGGSGMSSRDANDYLNSLNPATRQQYEKIALMVDKITHKNAQLLVDYGVESQDTIDKWFNKYKHYVPLFREDIEERPGTGRGFSVYGKASQMRKGSERKVVNILSNISMQRERYLTKGEKNRIDQALVFLEKEFPNEKFWTSYKIPDMKTYVPRGQKVETAGNVIIARILNKETGKIEHIALEFNSKDDRAMRMVKALKNMDMDTVGEVMGVLSKITRYVASINTQYNPVFGITNFFRDMGTAAFNLSTTPIAGKQKEVLQGAFPAIKGIYSALKGDRSSTEAKLFEEYQLEGGQVGYRNLWITSEDRAKEIEKELKSFQSGKPKRFLNKIARLLSDYNTTMENAVRLSAYKVGLESKDAHGHPLMTREQAAVMAKNLTVNFNKKGQIAGQAGALYAFFNASVQGAVRMYETLRGPMGKKIIAGGIILGATQAMMLAAAGFKDEEPPEFVKERNIVIPIGGKKYLTFPMPLGFNVIPNVGRILAEITLGGGKNAGIKMSNLAGTIFEAFNPMGSSGWSMQTVAPTFLDPFAALAENKDWTGKPIYKEDFNALNPTPGTSRVKDSATVFGRGLAWAFNILTGGDKYTPGLFSPTPDQIDYLGGQITGGLGREIAKTSMMFESLYTGEELPAYKLPLTGRFYGTAEGQANESSKYYSNLKKLNIHEANIKGRIKDREPIGEYIKDNPEAKLWRMANTIENNISKLKKRKELAKTPDAKKTYDKLITLQMKRLNDMVEKIEK